MANFIKVGAGWKTKSGNGHNCIIDVDVAAGDRILIFTNKQKKEPKHPDIIIGYFDDDEEKQQERDKRQNEPARYTPPDDDIPF